MRTFCTHKYVNGEEYEGENIQAESFEEAEKKAKELGLVVDGWLHEEWIGNECVSYV